MDQQLKRSSELKIPRDQRRTTSPHAQGLDKGALYPIIYGHVIVPDRSQIDKNNQTCASQLQQQNHSFFFVFPLILKHFRRRRRRMCGIFAYLNFHANKERRYILDVLFNGLRRLEYRGYDSAGIAIDSSSLSSPPLVFRQAGNIESLVNSVNEGFTLLSLSGSSIYISNPKLFFLVIRGGF